MHFDYRHWQWVSPLRLGTFQDTSPSQQYFCWDSLSCRHDTVCLIHPGNIPIVIPTILHRVTVLPIANKTAHRKLTRFRTATLRYVYHYNDFIMSAMTFQITSLMIVFSTAYSGRSNLTSKFRVTEVCEVNSPVTGECPAQQASNAKNVSIWWSHHDTIWTLRLQFVVKYNFITVI